MCFFPLWKKLANPAMGPMPSSCGITTLHSRIQVIIGCRVVEPSPSIDIGCLSIVFRLSLSTICDFHKLTDSTSKI